MKLYDRFINITNKVNLQTVGIRKKKNVEGVSIETTDQYKDRHRARLAMLTSFWHNMKKYTVENIKGNWNQREDSEYPRVHVY